MNRLLVTGASGFIGNAVIRALAGHAFETVCVSRSSHADDGVRWIGANLLDSADIRSTIHAVRPTHLLHLAWVTTPGDYWFSPENLQWLMASVELFRVFTETGGRRVVASGSCAEYEGVDGWCVEATTPLRPNTLYGKCKLALADTLSAISAGSNVGTVWARLFYPYGPSEPQAKLVASVVDALLRAEHVDCTEGQQERDFIFVDDLAEAMVALVVDDCQGVFNIGTGQPVKVRDVIQEIARQIGREDLVRFGAKPMPPHEPLRLVADMRKTFSTIGWRPRTTLSEGVSRCISARRI